MNSLSKKLREAAYATSLGIRHVAEQTLYWVAAKQIDELQSQLEEKEDTKQNRKKVCSNPTCYLNQWKMPRLSSVTGVSVLASNKSITVSLHQTSDGKNICSNCLHKNKEGKLAPWKDYKGNNIFDGDWIVHPDGSLGRVYFDEDESDSYDAWKVIYTDEPYEYRLNLQIGDKGKAVVFHLK